MPNWVENRLTITGDQDSLDKLREMVGKSYKTFHQDFMTNEINEATIVGSFLLWNIASPTDLATYHGFTSDEEFAEREARVEKAKQEQPESPEEFVKKLDGVISNMPPMSEDILSQFQREVETKQDWYHWNIREWGTKWEIDGAQLLVEEGKLKYAYSTAWSPPIQAIDKLAEMFPTLSFHSRFIDENDCFAGEVFWESGEQTYEHDIRIDHALKIEMYGDCWACSNTLEEYDEVRASYRCAEYNKLVVPDTIEGLV
jgi:hypothetical protein